MCLCDADARKRSFIGLQECLSPPPSSLYINRKKILEEILASKYNVQTREKSKSKEKIMIRNYSIMNSAPINTLY